MVSVDKFLPKGAKASITKLDLTRRDVQLLVLDWVRQPDVVGAFIVPPCGTASAAREIPLEDEPFAPKPLRTLLQPDGIDDLSGDDALRVGSANILYDFVQELWDLCTSLGKICIVENPVRSLFWFTSFWLERQWCAHVYIQDHQACYYGSLRPKWTRLVANFKHVFSINGTCPGDHYHEPWGVIRSGSKRTFATSLEVHYPLKLCDAIADAIVAQLVDLGFQLDDQLPLNPAAKLLAGDQVATTKLPPILPDFCNKFGAIYASDGALLWPAILPDLTNTKILHKFKLGAEVLQDSDRDANVLASNAFRGHGLDVQVAGLVAKSDCDFVIRGTFWSVEQFVDAARTVRYPLFPETVLPNVLLEALDMNLKCSPCELVAKRVNFVRKWTARAMELQSQELELRKGMDVWVARAIRGKRILLYKEMLAECLFPDPEVVDELVCGADLIGDVPRTKMLPAKFKPAVCSEATLKLQASHVRSLSASEVGSSGDDFIDSEVWRKTLEEVECGWLVGPLTEDEVPLTAPVTKRFGLQQKKGKVRLIDDFSASGVNSCVTTCESPSFLAYSRCGLCFVCSMVRKMQI